MIKKLVCLIVFLLACPLPGLCEAPQRFYQFDGSELPESSARYMQSVVMANDMFYLYMDDFGIYRWNPKNDQCELFCQLPTIPSGIKAYEYDSLPYDQRESVGEAISYIASDGQTLYGFSRYSGKICKIEEQSYSWLEKPLNIELLTQNGQSFALTNILVMDDIIYALDEENHRIIAMAIYESTAKAYSTPNLQNFCSYEDNQLLLLCEMSGVSDTQYSFSVLDLKSGSIQELFTNPLPDAVDICAPAYHGGSIYCTENANILRLQTNGKFEIVASNPASYLSQFDPGWILSDGSYAFYSSGIHVVVAEGEDTTLSLTIQGELPMADEIQKLFQKSFPEVNVTWIRQPCDAALAGEKIRNGDAAVDVFVLKTDYAFTKFIDNSYAWPLSDSSALASLADDLYDEIKGTVTNAQGTLCAYPVAFSFNMWQINEALWAKVTGNSAPPQTYSQLLKAVIQFVPVMEDDTVFLFSFDYYTMLTNVIASYIRQNERFDTPVSFDDFELRSTLLSLKKVAEMNSAGMKIAFVSETDIPIFYQSGGSAVLRSVPEAQRDYQYCLPPSVGGTDVPVQGELTVLCINPNSLNKQYALAYLEAAAQKEANVLLYYGIHSSSNQPLESTKYLENTEKLQTEFNNLQSQLEVTDSEEITLIKEKLADVQWRLENPEFQRWIISPQAIAEYKNVITHVKLFSQSMLLSSEGSVIPPLLELCHRYCDEGFQLDDFITNMDRVSKMIYYER